MESYVQGRAVDSHILPDSRAVSESCATRLLNRDVLDGYPPNERLVIFVLALMANAKRGAYPSDRTLARKCGVGRDTVRMAKARAEKDGVITRAVAKRGSAVAVDRRSLLP